MRDLNTMSEDEAVNYLLARLHFIVSPHEPILDPTFAELKGAFRMMGVEPTRDYLLKTFSRPNAGQFLQQWMAFTTSRGGVPSAPNDKASVTATIDSLLAEFEEFNKRK
jgi:hypothetical protein